MKAVVVEEPGKISIVEREIPEITPNQVLVKVKAAGICGSDVGIYHGKNAFATYPRVVGHEFVGEVVKVGSNVNEVAVGEHVAVDPVVSCGHCHSCQIGRHNVCKDLQVMGVHLDGGYQEYVAVTPNQLNPIEKSIPWEVAATVEPFSIGSQVAHQGRLTSDDTVLICGAGPIGLIILQVAKMKGAKVAIMDIVESRLEIAKNMGADFVINSKKVDVLDASEKFTNGDGYDLIYEATGNVNVLQMCIQKLAARAGRIVVLGFSAIEFPLRQLDIMSKELEIIGTRLNNYRFPEVISWFNDHKVDPKGIITHTFSFTDAAEAFKFNDEHPEKVLKIVLTF